MRHSFRKSLPIIIILVIITGLFTGCQYSFTYNGSTHVLKKSDAKHFTVKKAATEKITQIDINTSIASVELIPSDQYSVEINYYYWEEEPSYSLKDGLLEFDDSKALPNSYSINFNLDNRIKVYLPEKAELTKLMINNASGDVSLAGFVAKNLQVSISSGDLTLKNAAVESSKISLSSGDSKLTDVQTGQLDLTSSSGDVDFNNINAASKLMGDITYDSFRVYSSSGDITINGLTSNKIKLNNSSGDITCKDLKADDFETELSSGDITVKHSDLNNINLSSSYGDVDLGLLGTVQDYSYNLNTSYGDVRVGNKSYDEKLNLDGGARRINASLSSGDITIHFY